mmetsp:Transcript_26156/g.25338  ORF Transcript_26156/g.25338 Transcript_26156/m.25338 type:complete len:81 (+) Transcript_26156:996-1238(+)
MKYGSNLTSLLSNYNRKTVQKRVVGLDNPKYYCYFNSIMQILLGSDAFCNYFFYKEYSNINFPTHFQTKSYAQAYSHFVS